jgi:transposase
VAATSAPSRQTRDRIKKPGHTSAELRSLAVKCEDGQQVCRLLAIEMVLDGRLRREAALNGMDRQTSRDWVERSNADDARGLKSRQASGRAPALSAQQKAELRELVVKGPDPATDDVVHWRQVDLRAVIARPVAVEVHMHTVSRRLNQRQLTLL